MSRLQDSGEFHNFQNCSIFPVVSEEQTRSFQMADGQAKVGTKIYPISLSDVERLKGSQLEYQNVPFAVRDCREGTMLMRHPFRPYELIPTSTSDETIIKDHLHDLAMIFAALGAKDAEENVRIVKQQTIDIKANGRVKIKTVRANGDFRRTKKEKKELNLTLIIKRDPAEDAGYQKAYALAEKYHLLENHEISEILRQFDPDIGGKQKCYHLDESLSEQYNQHINATLNVNASNVFTFKGELHQDYKRRRELRITKDIWFIDKP